MCFLAFFRHFVFTMELMFCFHSKYHHMERIAAWNSRICCVMTRASMRSVRNWYISAVNMKTYKENSHILYMYHEFVAHSRHPQLNHFWNVVSSCWVLKWNYGPANQRFSLLALSFWSLLRGVWLSRPNVSSLHLTYQ